MGTTFGLEIDLQALPVKFRPGWSDIKWGRGDKVALAACKLGGHLGSLARYKERGEVPEHFNRGRYRRKELLRRFMRCTGMMRRTNERFFWYKEEDELPTPEAMEITDEEWQNIFIDYYYEPRWWHPFVWIATGGWFVWRHLKRAYVRVCEWVFDRLPMDKLFAGE
jgi:hypothetical protein